MYLYDASLSTKTIVLFGSKVNFLITDGEYFRFITPIFLHLNLEHLAFNSLALYILGRDIEIIFGKLKFLSIYLISGLIATVSSFLLTDAISAGASGAIFGLMGAHIFLYFTFKEKYKKIYGNSFLVLIAINIGYGFIHPNIDNIGHIGGLLGGILLSYIVHVKDYKLNLKRKVLLYIIIPLLILSSSFIGIKKYDNSVKYHIYKSLTLIRMESFEKAEKAIYIGKKEYPQYLDFDNLLELLDTKKKSENNL